MQTEKILLRLWSEIQKFHGVNYSSLVKTKHNQDREFTVSFTVDHLHSTPLFDEAEEKSDKKKNT